MNADERRLEINATCEKVIGCAYTVANILGIGFVEKVYKMHYALNSLKLG